jgi:uncharacterized GH25 family protein
MMITAKKTRLAVAGLSTSLLFSVLIQGEALAHSGWLDIRKNEVVMVDGHPDTGESRSYDVSRLVSYAAFDKSGKAVHVDMKHDGEAKFPLSKSVSMINAHFNNGFWAVSASEGWVRKPGSQVPDAERSMYSHKFSRAYVGPTSEPDKLMGYPLEMVALSDPSAAKPGSKLKVRVTLFGEPLVGAEVKNDLHKGDDAETVTTDSNGVAEVTVPDRDYVIVEAKHSVGLSDDPHVDSLALSSSISYRPSR